MSRHIIQHLFDCDLCMQPVASDQDGFDVENNLCADCKDATDIEAMNTFMPVGMLNKVFGPSGS